MSISISEPGAGSDVAAVSCAAEPASGGYVLNGQKTWCSYAHRAGRILLVARTSREDKPHAGLTIFEVPADSDGVSNAPDLHAGRTRGERRLLHRLLRARRERGG